MVRIAARQALTIAGIASLFVTLPASAGQVGAGLLVGQEFAVVHKVQRGGYCETLRRACLYKRELGEQGQGNCRRYQQECGGRDYGPPRYSPQYRGPGRCEYWRNRCANAYGWQSKGWYDCMRYGAPGC
jgi:hypothetical protein